jgi:hypothetical protein
MRGEDEDARHVVGVNGLGGRDDGRDERPAGVKSGSSFGLVADVAGPAVDGAW